MNIYLIRHAEAEHSSAAGGDFERKLTKEGKISVRKAAEGWIKLIHSVDYIISSPLTRAVQTAKITAEVFNYGEEIIIDKKLISGGTTEDLIDIANSLDAEEIFFVGHQPDMAVHISRLVSHGSARFEFKKAAIAKISFHNRAHLAKGVLEFLIPPIFFK